MAEKKADVILVPVDQVRPNEWNPNVVPEHIARALVKNIDRAGFNQPILVRRHPDGNGYEIVDGEHRWRYAQETGRTEVPVVIRDFTDAEAKAQTIAMNKLRGEMDAADVARLVREIDEDGLNLAELSDFTGYTLDELEAGQRLLDFNWDDMGAAPGDDGGAGVDPEDGEWIELKYRVPRTVAVLFDAEVERVKGLLGTEHDHLALEAMYANSVNTPESDYVGGS